MEMNSISDNFEFGHLIFVLVVSGLSQFSNICLDPLRLNSFFALMVDKLAAKHQACRNVILTFKRQL
jgi:hypothetical protein